MIGYRSSSCICCIASMSLRWMFEVRRIWEHPMKRPESVWRQRHPVLELGSSAYLSPRVSAFCERARGDLYTEASILDVAICVNGNRGGWGSRLFLHRLTDVLLGRRRRKPPL